MEVNVGDRVEAVDQLGIWAKAKVVRKVDNTVVVNFPPWKAEWDRETCDPSEIREQTPEETLIPHCLSQNKVRATDVICLLIFFYLCLHVFHKKSNLFSHFLCFQLLNLKKLFKGDIVYVNGKEVNVLQSDHIRKAVSVSPLL